MTKLSAAARWSVCALLGLGMSGWSLARPSGVMAASPAPQVKKPAPDDPEQPGQPEKPAKPEKPDSPNRPGRPPEKPDGPNKPDSPATPSDDQEKRDFPSPAELMKKMRQQRDKEKSKPTVVLFDLSEPIGESEAEFSLFGDYRLNMRTLLDRLERARADKNVKGVLVTLGNPGLSLSQALEVRDAMAEVVKAGKPVFVHADAFDTTLYTLATGASDICMLEGGEMMMPGVGIESMFLKGLFDKVGLKADYVQIGEYKGADEQYTRTGASEELRGEMKKLIDGLYTELVNGIAEHRKIDREVVRRTIDESMCSGTEAKSRGLVDHLIDQDGMRDLIAKKVGGEVSLDPYYGMERPELDLSNPFGILSSLTKPSKATQKSDADAVAIIYAEGVIVDGDAEGGLLGDSGNIGSDNMRRAFRMAARDDKIKAVVVRIDSPGGSALASEVMWQGLRRLAEKKPVIVSVGGMAASGGYYLASASDTIYADPTAIVGSIGVVGGKFVMKDLFDWAGVKTETFSAGRNADLFSSNQPFSDRQRVLVTTWMKSTYDQFTSRVMSTRKGKIADIDRVARGRIFVARQAKELGMVDELGGLQEAVATVANKAKLGNNFDVRQVPPPKTLGDYLSGHGDNGPDAASPLRPRIEIKLDGLIGQLSPSLRLQALKQLQMMQLLQERPVALVSPFIVTIK